MQKWLIKNDFLGIFKFMPLTFVHYTPPAIKYRGKTIPGSASYLTTFGFFANQIITR